MSDNPNLKHVDAKTVSSQSFEIEYVVEKLQRQFPRQSRDAIRQAVIEAKQEAEPSEGRDEVMQRAEEKLQ